MTALSCAGMLVAACARPALAHRLDEYLIATTIQVSGTTLRVDMRPAPGVSVSRTVLDSIDTNRDGRISETERSAYAAQLLRDVTLAVDGQLLALRLVAARVDDVETLVRGTGEMFYTFEASVPAGSDRRHVTFDNRHRSAIAAYLVNSLVPEDSSITIVDQSRNYTQSLYEMTYTQTVVAANAVSFGDLGKWGVAVAGLMLVAAEVVTRGRAPSR